jgi:hypothetical protein
MAEAGAAVEAAVTLQAAGGTTDVERAQEPRRERTERRIGGG